MFKNQKKEEENMGDKKYSKKDLSKMGLVEVYDPLKWCLIKLYLFLLALILSLFFFSGHTERLVTYFVAVCILLSYVFFVYYEKKIKEKYLNILKKMHREEFFLAYDGIKINQVRVEYVRGVLRQHISQSNYKMVGLQKK